MTAATEFVKGLHEAVDKASIPEPRRRGRPRKIAIIRDENVSSSRAAQPGRAQALGRDGAVLTRKRVSENDKFFIPPEIIPEGWTYEWKRKSIYSQEDVDHITGLMENGWTPVPAARHTGRFMVRSNSGEIVRDGLMLMERPIELTKEARAEDTYNARMLVHMQNEQYRARMPNGMDATHPDARARFNASYEPSPAERPGLTLARD